MSTCSDPSKRAVRSAEATALAGRAALGDRAAADALSHLLTDSRMLHRWATTFVTRFGRACGGGDLAADGLTRLPEAIRSYDPARAEFLTYFRRAVWNHWVRSAFGRSDRPRLADKQVALTEDEWDAVPGRSDDDPAAEAEANSAADRVRRILDKMDGKDALVLKMVYGIGVAARGPTEIDREYGLGRNTTVMRAKRAKRKFMAMYAEN